ncbi:Molybdopterin-guanine dinucleotide biosynthesis protein MobA [Helicobacter sp. NHP19-012]|uniref:Molybdopterin-guanine dinucleotide biosynthesis protein MobA n=2 Tax=Helicobacter TaxID=209 RepID=A0ABN6I8T3_9HELI|nr:NTP transferase domain-containing protein [Helicobacter sp. NHP19-012]BCZ19417.1 Molybdopterin-guanine dinucleotide biosynthesis protein MobA [Helicobacter sp. NHP19-012]GMB96408.1 Molybdopterin-guanine dinucleotide biosynthesis protein MobA [Helicobacter sp. NHP22-001]
MQIEGKQFDKALLPFGNGTLLEYQYHKLQAWFQGVYISCKERYHLSASYLIEGEGHFNPLVGMVHGLAALRSPLIFIPVDMPFITQESLLKLYKNRQKAPLVYLKSPKTFYLPNLCQPSALDLLQEALDEEQEKVGAVFKKIGFGVEVKESKEFCNLNTYSDYIKALNG